MADFVWGDGGAQLTPEAIAGRRKIAEAMIAKGMDTSPIKSWTQGAARVAQAMIGAYDDKQLGQQDAASTKAALGDLNDLAVRLQGGGAPVAPAGAPGGIPATAAPVATSPATAPTANPADNPGKIYANDESSPLDPPSGDDRKRMAMTILGEAANEPAAGQNAVASVIRTRAVDGGYGGDTPSAVVTAKNQFEPWNTPDGRARMERAYADPVQRAAAERAIALAYGEGGRAPEDPTGGMTHFYSPGAQAVLGRSAPAWAGQGESVRIGGHVFNSPDDAPTGAVPSEGASPAAIQTVANAAQQAGLASAAAPTAPVRPSVAEIMRVASNPFLPKSAQPLAAALLASALKPRDSYSAPYTDNQGNYVQRGSDGKISVISAAEKAPGSVQEYEYYKKNFQPSDDRPNPMDYATWSTAKARAGAANTNINNTVDTGNNKTYDTQLVEGLAKSHAALANGVEEAQARARDVAAMQGAVDMIKRNGGTTGGMGQEQALNLKKTINSGLSALGIDAQFNEGDISDKEFLTKFNRQMAGNMAKGAVGGRVTNFEMSNYLKANPGLDMSITGNQRLLGIQAQIEQRNIAVGNAIRQATASAVSQGKKIDPVAVQKIISDFDDAHHITDPVTGQDLTQSYTLPEFQKGGTNQALAEQNSQNIGKIRRYNPQTGALE